MQSEVMVILKQLCIMFMMMGLGFILYRKRMLSDDTTKQISNLILYVVNPCLTLVSFMQSFAMEKLVGFMVVFVYSLVLIFLGLVIGRLVLGKERRLEQYACGFTNAGFIGIPLVQTLLGTESLFYLSAFLVAYNLVSWTVGLYLVSGKNQFKLKVFVTNPAILAVFGGMFLFLSQFALPTVITETLTSIGNMNTPLGMLVLGTYIANDKLSAIFTSKMGYAVSGLRLLVVPLVMILFLKVVYVPFEQIRTVLLIAACAPCGVTLAMFSQLYGGDYSYGARIVSLSTLFCVVSIPLMMTMARWIW